MAVPFRKTSKSVKKIRRGNKGLAQPTLAKNANGEYVVPHQVDANGCYNGEQVIAQKEEKKSE